MSVLDLTVGYYLEGFNNRKEFDHSVCQIYTIKVIYKHHDGTFEMQWLDCECTRSVGGYYLVEPIKSLYSNKDLVIARNLVYRLNYEAISNCYVSRDREQHCIKMVSMILRIPTKDQIIKCLNMFPPPLRKLITQYLIK